MMFSKKKEAEASQNGSDTDLEKRSNIADSNSNTSNDNTPGESIPTDGDGNVLNPESGKVVKNMTRWDTSFVLLCNQIGIGILSLPATLQVLGIVPGIIALIGLGLLSTYTAYELLQFQQKHPHCVNMVDMCKVVGGRVFEIVGAFCLLVNITFTCASAIVTMSVGLNTMSSHGTCTAAFMAISAIGCWILCLPRTFKFVGKVGVPCTIAVLAAVLTVMISLGVADPVQAPAGWKKEIKIVGNPDFSAGVGACLRICYSFAGNVGFPSVIAEMKDPKKDFVPSLIWLQAFSIPLYIIVAIVIYCLAGQYTASPALGSAPETPAKVAYGIMLLALLSTGMVFGHTAIKYMFVFVLRRANAAHEATQNTVKSWVSWVGCATVFWACAFIVAGAVPVFDSILSISSATLIAWTTFGISAVLWLHMQRHQLFKDWKKISLLIVNVLIIIMSLFMNSAGMWSAITSLLDIFDDPNSNLNGAFTCADNSIF